MLRYACHAANLLGADMHATIAPLTWLFAWLAFPPLVCKAYRLFGLCMRDTLTQCCKESHTKMAVARAMVTRSCSRQLPMPHYMGSSGLPPHA
eukprot:2830097-Amphidinium_carterae.2